jgi:TolB-like protein/class 3 adenylate cyclase/cytochrome c-type biogenesis protein CcmH/NrfG
MRSRLAAILAADAAGYSRLIAQDDRATVAALDVARQVFRTHIEASQGRVIDTAGDSVLAVFETAAGAVSAALAVQRDLSTASSAVPVDQRLRFRIGVHLGDVIEKADGTVYGDGVNIAARLQAMAKPGGINVSDSVRTAVLGKVEAQWTDLGEQRLKNIAVPVRAHAVNIVSAPGPARKSVAGWSLPSVSVRPSRGVGLALAAVVLLGTALAFTQAGSGVRSWLATVTGQDRAREASGRAVIAVLPFANLSGDPTRDYFSNGLTEDIINALGRFSGVMVISHSAVQPYKGKSASVGEISRDLGVRYIVQGSARQANDRLRVTAELGDARTGSQLWSDRLDGQGKDIFDMQDRIVRGIVGALAVKLTSLEQQRVKAKPMESLEAYDLVLQARDLIQQAERGANRQARELLQRAIATSPNDAEAYVALAKAEFHRASLGFVEDAGASFRRAEEYARKALALDERRAHAGAHAILARTYVVQGEHHRGLAAAEQAVALNPSEPVAYGARAEALLYLGKIEEAIANFEIAQRLDPRDALDIGGQAAMAYFIAGRFADAISTAEAHLARNPSLSFMQVARIAALAEAGRLDEARQQAKILRAADPFFQVEQVATRFKDPAHTERFQRALRTAGL